MVVITCVPRDQRRQDIVDTAAELHDDRRFEVKDIYCFVRWAGGVKHIRTRTSIS